MESSLLAVTDSIKPMTCQRIVSNPVDHTHTDRHNEKVTLQETIGFSSIHLTIMSCVVSKEN